MAEILVVLAVFAIALAPLVVEGVQYRLAPQQRTELAPLDPWERKYLDGKIDVDEYLAGPPAPKPIDIGGGMKMWSPEAWAARNKGKGARPLPRPEPPIYSPKSTRGRNVTFSIYGRKDHV